MQRFVLLSLNGYLMLVIIRDRFLSTKQSSAPDLSKTDNVDILGNTLVRLLAESQMRRSIPRSCLYAEYEARASNQLALRKDWKQGETASLA